MDLEEVADFINSQPEDSKVYIGYYSSIKSKVSTFKYNKA